MILWYYNMNRDHFKKILIKLVKKSNICKVKSVETTILSLEPKEILSWDSISVGSLSKEWLLLFG